MKFTQIPADAFRRMVLNAAVIASAFDPDRLGRRQTLLTCATDSTAALESLAANVEFVNTPTRKRGQVLVEDNGTKLVYRGAAGGTMIVVQ